MLKSVRQITVVVAIVAVTATGSTGAGAEHGTDPFQGQWSIKATPDEAAAAAGQPPVSEALLFHKGEVAAAVFSLLGFRPAPYHIHVDTGRPVFRATLTARDGGRLNWSGRETPSGLDGTLTWTRKDGRVLNFKLTGERQ